MSGLGEHVAAHAGQSPVRCGQPLVHVVHPAGEPADAVQLQLESGGAGQHARHGAPGDQGAYRIGVKRHIGVKVDAGEGLACLVAEAQRVRLTRYRRLDDPRARLCRG